jgi:hypothetical protein
MLNSSLLGLYARSRPPGSGTHWQSVERAVEDILVGLKAPSAAHFALGRFELSGKIGPI